MLIMAMIAVCFFVSVEAAADSETSDQALSNSPHSRRAEFTSASEERRATGSEVDEFVDTEAKERRADAPPAGKYPERGSSSGKPICPLNNGQCFNPGEDAIGTVVPYCVCVNQYGGRRSSEPTSSYPDSSRGACVVDPSGAIILFL